MGRGACAQTPSRASKQASKRSKASKAKQIKERKTARMSIPRHGKTSTEANRRKVEKELCPDSGKPIWRNRRAVFLNRAADSENRVGKRRGPTQKAAPKHAPAAATSFALVRLCSSTTLQSPAEPQWYLGVCQFASQSFLLLHCGAWPPISLFRVLCVAQEHLHL